jgi:glycerol uptake facilitator-like aquaporin
MKKYIAEFIGIFWLVFDGCGSAVFAAAVPSGDNNQRRKKQIFLYLTLRRA